MWKKVHKQIAQLRVKSVDPYRDISLIKTFVVQLMMKKREKSTQTNYTTESQARRSP